LYLSISTITIIPNYTLSSVTEVVTTGGFTMPHDLPEDWYLDQSYEDRYSYDEPSEPDDCWADGDALASAGHGMDEDYNGYDDWDDSEAIDCDAEF